MTSAARTLYGFLYISILADIWHHHPLKINLVSKIAASRQTHWLYARDALQYLILNIEYEVPVSAFQIKHFLEMACNPHQSKVFIVIYIMIQAYLVPHSKLLVPVYHYGG